MDRQIPEHGLLRAVEDDSIEATRGRRGNHLYREIVLGSSLGGLFNGKAGQILT
jgi:hypothetical protein